MTKLDFSRASVAGAAIGFLGIFTGTLIAGQNDRTRPPDREAMAMDYGPCMANTFEAPKGNLTLKGVLVKLDKEHDANLLFDTELCRVSCTWVGPTLHLASRVFSGDNDFHCTIDGGIQFATAITPGWKSGEKQDDPRNPKDGPLPHDWIRYKGLYLHANQAVLSYSVGTTDVMEMPGVTFDGGRALFHRDLRIAPHEQPLEMLVYELTKDDLAPASESQGVLKAHPLPTSANFTISPELADHALLVSGVAGAPNGTTFVTSGLRTYLKIPPATTTTVLRVAVARIPVKADEPPLGSFPIGSPADPEPLTHGGPARWKQTLTTTGELGAVNAPYVIDTIKTPTDNPYHSWLRFTGIDIFPDGKRAALCTWNGDVWVVSGIDHDLKQLTWKRFATGLNNPMGVKIVDGIVHTIDRSQITKLIDIDGDGEADLCANVNNDCTLTPNFHEMAFDLQTDSRGDFYFSKSSAIWAPPLRLAEHAGCVLKVSKDGSKLEKLCTGLRAPNGVSVGPDDRVYTTDNQGNWVPSCPINLIKRDAFYGYSFHEGRPEPPAEREKPLCWIPYNRDKSAGALVWDLGDQWGPFKGHMIECSYDCSIFEVIQEMVGDQVQGGVVKFPLHFPSGVMRGRFNPVDGQLYLAGLRGWSSGAAREECFQRVRYTGKPVYYPVAVKTAHDGMEITFSGALDPKSVEADNIGAEQYNVVRTSNYGSPEFSVKDPKKAAHDDVPIKSARLLPDGKTVAIEVPGLRPSTNFTLTFRLTAADRTPVEQELDYTLNVVP